VGVLTRAEEQEFEEGLSKVAIYELLGAKECPYCQECVMKPQDL